MEAVIEQGAIVLDVRNLTKSYGARTAVNNVSLTVKRGEVFGFLGPNGAGKTTFIKAITGLSKYDSGSVMICGHDLKTDFVGAMNHVGAIIETPDLFAHLSGLDNLRYLASFYPNVTEQDVMNAIEFVGMTARCRDKLSRYSLGMKQRIGIAQAMIHNPSLLILDEPTNGLDPQGIKEIRELFLRLARERGVSILISSHILHEMQLMCSRVGIISKGILRAVRPIGEELDGNGLHSITVTVDAPVPAAEIIARVTGIQPKMDMGKLFCNATKAQTGALNAALVAAGITVYGLSAKERTLEDLFIELTGEGSAI